MARQEGIIKFSGELGGLVAYQLNGKWVIRRKGNVSKKRYANDPSFDIMRRSNKEFGGASIIAKALREPWKFYINKCKDNSLHYRMNALLMENMKMSPGIFGQRLCSWNVLADNMSPFKINNTNPLDHYLSKVIQMHSANNTILWASDNIGLTNALTGTTHFKVFTLINEIPDFSFSSELDKYTKENYPLIKIELAAEISPITETISFNQSTPALPESKYFTIAQGIVFYQLVNNSYNELAELPLEWIGVLCT